MPDVYALVRSIREQRWSRNRHFSEHDTVSGAAARRLHRYLEAIERDLLDAAAVHVERSAAGYRISIGRPSVRLTRIAVLSAESYALLRENPRLRALLSVDCEKDPGRVL